MNTSLLNENYKHIRIWTVINNYDSFLLKWLLSLSATSKIIPITEMTSDFFFWKMHFELQLATVGKREAEFTHGVLNECNVYNTFFDPKCQFMFSVTNFFYQCYDNVKLFVRTSNVLSNNFFRCFLHKS